MDFMKKLRKGFTLVELLVVIAIIALLLSIILPALSIAKETGKRAVCRSNLRQLTLAWIMHAEDNDSEITGSNIGYPPLGTVSGGCWVDWPTNGFTGLETAVEVREAKEAIQAGSLWQYCEDIALYRCPNTKRMDFMAYAIVDSMNGWGGWGGVEDKVIKKMSQIRLTGERMVFICETPADYGGGRGSWGIEWSTERWFDAPPIRHGKGTTFSFADGHVEYWKWNDPRTRDPDTTYGSTSLPQEDNEDLHKVQRAVWGSLGY